MRFPGLLLLLSLSLRSATLNSHLLLSLSLSRPTYITADLLTATKGPHTQRFLALCAPDLDQKTHSGGTMLLSSVAVDANPDGSTICNSFLAEHPVSNILKYQRNKLFLFRINPCVLPLVHSLLDCTVVKNHRVMTEVGLSIACHDAFRLSSSLSRSGSRVTSGSGSVCCLANPTSGCDPLAAS